MSIIFSPVISMMLRAIRKSSKALIRDFNEIRYLQLSYAAASDFTRSAYTRSNKIITEELYNYRQDYKVVFENYKDLSDIGEIFWFVIPMDSRTNFMNYIPYFTTSIALVKKEEVVAAIIDAPILQETYYAEKGSGAFAENGHSRYVKMHIGNKQSITRTVVDFSTNNSSINILINQLKGDGLILRSMGSITMGFVNLCTACYDIILYSQMHKYKASIGELFIKESKGSVLIKNGVFIASNFALCELLSNKINSE
ncbi:inositol monophosphatase family protein [Neoehrlichia mikurensis]|uniref:Inositol monophosphatase family protein n=1 Tax=Neoehrlichia mikurensis TaxID=89586 RepID=A0A9Q9BU69_9RICK|nr:inositol monophosphatase family protein [Neoehrlichia mikurensis]UTO55271.1 inositol monophosphatase family protein [Neoehrlichia mikurensis]UTO56191.1 inositol monophosphatase family protein [Neoehrlichia mikurensis]